jgi:hypothetical protein
MRQQIRNFIIFILGLLLILFTAYTVFRMYEESEIIKFKRNQTVEKEITQKIFDEYIAGVRSEHKIEIEKIKKESDEKIASAVNECKKSSSTDEAKLKSDDEFKKINQAKADLEKEKERLKIERFEFKNLMERQARISRRIQVNCREKFHESIHQSCLKFLGIPSNQLHIAESKLWMMEKDRNKYQGTKNVFVCIDQTGKKFPYFLMSGPEDLENSCRVSK